MLDVPTIAVQTGLSFCVLKYVLAPFIFLHSLSVRSVLLAALRQEAHDATLPSDVFHCGAHGPTRAPSTACQDEDPARRRDSAAR